MKKLKIIYWIITGLFVAGMLTSTIPSVVMMPYAVEHFTKHLGFPAHFLFFTGLTKALGIVALFIPGYPKVKEWVYAGFTFDLIGAMYCTLAVGDPITSILFQLVALIFMAASYVYFVRVQKLATTSK
ncbi:MAG: DoxX family protein [Bacteroidota bacterium]